METAPVPLLPPHTLLADPDHPFEAVRAARRAQFGLGIAHITAQVGPGTEYANEAARAVVSAQGGWFQLAEMPEEFAGATGAGVSHRLLPRPEIAALMARWSALLEQALRGGLGWRKLSVYALYAGGSLRSGQGMFVLDSAAGRPLFTAGAWQPGAVPRALKLCVGAEADPSSAAMYGLPARGVQFFLTPAHTDNGAALLGTLAPSPGSADLGARPTSAAAH